MSYDVAFDKQFIKTRKDKYITLTLIGDSSLTTGYGKNERMSRSWGIITPIVSKEEVLEDWKTKMGNHMEDYDTGKDNILWGMGFRIPGKSSYDDMLNWLKTGMRKAITFEQLKEMGYDLKVIGYQGLDRVYSERFDNEDEFLEAYDMAKKEYSSAYIATDWNETFAQGVRRRFFPRARKNQNKELKTVDKFYTIKVNTDNYGNMYFAKHTARSVKMDYTPYKKYANEKAAQRLVDKYNKKYPHRKYWVEEVNSPTRMYV